MSSSGPVFLPRTRRISALRLRTLSRSMRPLHQAGGCEYESRCGSGERLALRALREPDGTTRQLGPYRVRVAVRTTRS